MKFYIRILTGLSLFLLTTIVLLQFRKHRQSTIDSKVTSKHSSNSTIYSGSSIRNDSVPHLKQSFTTKNKTLEDECEKAGEKRITNYYSGFTKKTYIIDIPINLLPVDVCGTRIRNDPYVVIMITSIPGHTPMRNTIRETWASFKDAGNISVESELNNKTIGLVFIVGNSGNSLGAAIRESRMYGDILQVDIEESHENLVYKVLAGLRWMADNCKGSKYLLKVDEDVYVHLPRLVPILQQHDGKDVLIGRRHLHSHKTSKPVRYGKYKLSFEQYKFCRFLTYAEGNAYVISAGLVPRLLNLSDYIPPNKIEDHYFTGILRSVASAPIVHDESFSRAVRSTNQSNIAQFYKYRKISETRCTGKEMKTLWLLYRKSITKR